MTTGTLPPPSTAVGPLTWLRRNLFSSIPSSIATGLILGLLIVVVVTIGGWTLTEARWSVVTNNLRLFLVGQYPVEEAWRLWLDLAILSVLAGVSGGIYGQTTRTLAVALSAMQLLLAVLMAVSPLGWMITAGMAANAALVWVGFGIGRVLPVPRWLVIAGWVFSIPVSYLLINGIGAGPLPAVGSTLWGGLLLTVLLAVVGILLSFPLGVLLALGRRSSLPAARGLSTAYIELIRGVPLVTLLFMADIMLPLLLPGEWRIDRVARAMGGITLFSAAYVAENVRGGLQAIPSGQYEAAHALGLNTFPTNLFIVLPAGAAERHPGQHRLLHQPAEGPTLVTIVGLLEILGIGRAILAQPESLGANLEVYVFVAAVFFALCYAMSQASYRLERALGVGSR